MTPAPAEALEELLDNYTRTVGEIANWGVMFSDQLPPLATQRVTEAMAQGMREEHLRLLAQQPAQAPAEAGLWLGDKDGLSAAGLAHALTLLPKKRRAQEAEVFCNGEPVTGVSILGKHGQSMGEFQVYLQTEGQPRSATDIQIYPALAAAEAGEAGAS